MSLDIPISETMSLFDTNTCGMEYICLICMETTVIKDEPDDKLCHFNGCKHTSCVFCLTEWFQYGHNDCPQCRTQCTGVCAVKYSIYLLKKEYIMLDREIQEMRHNIRSRCKVNSILRADMVRASKNIDKLIEEYGFFGCNIQSMIIQNMEEEGGLNHVPHHVRALNNIPVIFDHADYIKKITENHIILKTNMLQQNIIRDEYERSQIDKYIRRQNEITADINIFLSNYSLHVSEPESETEHIDGETTKTTDDGITPILIGITSTDSHFLPFY